MRTISSSGRKVLTRKGRGAVGLARPVVRIALDLLAVDHVGDGIGELLEEVADGIGELDAKGVLVDDLGRR